jgi:hypothetical protein
MEIERDMGELREMKRDLSEIRELLNAYKLVGIEVVLYLRSFHAVGYITKVYTDFVILQQRQNRVQSNDNGGNLENPNEIRVKISDILAVSDHQQKKSHRSLDVKSIYFSQIIQKIFRYNP